MPARKGSKTPSLRRHRPTGQAVVTIDGKDHYLGRHGSEAARAMYDQLIAGNGWQMDDGSHRAPLDPWTAR